MSPRPGRQPSTRTQVVGLLRQKLEADSYPRMQMGLIVALTGGMGLLCSFVLLRLGMHAMALRYPLALLGAYLFFLFPCGSGFGPTRKTTVTSPMCRACCPMGLPQSRAHRVRRWRSRQMRCLTWVGQEVPCWRRMNWSFPWR